MRDGFLCQVGSGINAAVVGLTLAIMVVYLGVSGLSENYKFLKLGEISCLLQSGSLINK